MGLLEENEEIIRELKEQIEKLGTLEIEEMSDDDISNKIEENCNYCKRIFDAQNQFRRLKHRTLAVNEKIIIKQEMLLGRIQQMDLLSTIPCGIEYMDMPLNNCNYLINSFYQELYKKYEKEPAKFIMLDMQYYNGNTRVLKLENLEEDEKKKAEFLNTYLILYSIQEQMNLLIDFIKCIMCNYVD